MATSDRRILEALNSEISRRFKRIPYEEQVELHRRWMEDQDYEAREQLVNSMLAFVIFTVKRFPRNDVVEFSDIVSAGFMGLLQAIDVWNPKLGALGTIATYYIRREVQTLYGKSVAPVSLPLNDVYKAKGSVSAVPFTHEDGEIDKAVDAECAIEPEHDIEQETTILDLVSLTDEQKDLLVRRFGFNGGEPQTLEEIGQAYGVSKQRAEQKVSAVLETLRKQLAGVYEESQREGVPIDVALLELKQIKADVAALADLVSRGQG